MILGSGFEANHTVRHPSARDRYLVFKTCLKVIASVKPTVYL